MGHKGSMEARYTTNKGMLPEALTSEMRESFARSEELLDLEAQGPDRARDQRQEMHGLIRGATPEELGPMLEALQGVGNMGRARQPLLQAAPSR